MFLHGRLDMLIYKKKRKNCLIVENSSYLCRGKSHSLLIQVVCKMHIFV